MACTGDHERPLKAAILKRQLFPNRANLGAIVHLFHNLVLSVLVGLMSDDFRLEDLLDSVADAVSALVLFASDANTDKKKLTNLQEGAKVVAASTSFFTTDAERTIRMWREFGNERTYLVESSIVKCVCIGGTRQTAE